MVSAQKILTCVFVASSSVVCSAQHLTAEQREKQMSALYVKNASKIYLDSLPAMQNMHDYLIKEDAGEKVPAASYNATLNNLEKNVRRYNTLKPITSTVKKAHSYSLAYMKNTIFQISYLRSWVKTRNQRYLEAGNEYAAKADNYLALMTNEYEAVMKKVESN